MGKLFNLKSYANKHLICIRNIAGHTAANWRVKKLNLNTISVSKWHIKQGSYGAGKSGKKSGILNRLFQGLE